MKRPQGSYHYKMSILRDGAKANIGLVLLCAVIWFVFCLSLAIFEDFSRVLVESGIKGFLLLILIPVFLPLYVALVCWYTGKHINKI